MPDYCEHIIHRIWARNISTATTDCDNELLIHCGRHIKLIIMELPKSAARTNTKHYSTIKIFKIELNNLHENSEQQFGSRSLELWTVRHNKSERRKQKHCENRECEYRVNTNVKTEKRFSDQDGSGSGQMVTTSHRVTKKIENIVNEWHKTAALLLQTYKLQLMNIINVLNCHKAEILLKIDFQMLKFRNNIFFRLR